MWGKKYSSEFNRTVSFNLPYLNLCFEQGTKYLRGTINTPMVAQSKKSDGRTIRRMQTVVPLGREGEPSEVAELICWLLCDGSTYISGTTQSIDGGWAC